jgi:hypothetical protein
MDGKLTACSRNPNAIISRRRNYESTKWNGVRKVGQANLYSVRINLFAIMRAIEMVIVAITGAE